MDTYQHQRQQQEQEQEALAAAQNASSSSASEEDIDDDGDLDDDMMDRISSSPSIEDEDIDFEFVYALHTFVATVEGQANAIKGDTMVLLDDSNSYWWLVRVVKDSSIGYLPAEHIETPTERLARLNKHRNIDLSATMLGDQAPKQKPGPLTSIVKRKKATVTFAEPTYFDYSDFDYSSEEEDIDELFGPDPEKKHGERTRREPKSTQASDGTDGGARVEPLRTRSSRSGSNESAATADSPKDARSDDEDSRSSSEIQDDRASEPGRSRVGTVRNTDSFFKDEETKKITLTPNLLRDDNAPRPSTDSQTKDGKDGKPRTSMEKLEKELVSDKERKKLSRDKEKKDKEKEKEKEKKPSAIRNFFSRKDKKRSADDDYTADAMSESLDGEDRPKSEPSSPDKPSNHPSKPQKPQPRTEPTFSNIGSTSQSSTVELVSYLAEGRINNVSNVPPPSMRIVNPETNETEEVPSNQPHKAREPAREQVQNTQTPRSSPSPKGPSIRTGTADVSSSSGARPQSATRAAMSRLALEASDGSDNEMATVLQQSQLNTSVSPPEAANDQNEKIKPSSMRVVVPGSFAESSETSTPVDKTITQLRQTQQSPFSRYADSPASMSVSPSSPIASTNPPPLMVDTESPDDRSPTASPSPEPVQSMDDAQKSYRSPRSSKEPIWDDIKLRAFFDEGDQIRDLLTVVYDKSDVVPAGYDHPIVGGLFREQNAKLAEITTQLDNMLGDWLARKQRLRGAI